MRWARILLVLVLAIGALVIAGVAIQELTRFEPEVGSAQEHPLIDERAGTYRAAGIGQTRAEVQTTLGPAPVKAGGGQLVSPLSRDIGEMHSALNGTCEVEPPRFGEFGTLRYELSMYAFDDRLNCGWITVEDGAATTSGVAIGDELDDARDAYPTLRCGETYFGEPGPFGVDEFPYCTGRVAPERFIWFGGDPIDTIELNTRPLGR